MSASRLLKVITGGAAALLICLYPFWAWWGLSRFGILPVALSLASIMLLRALMSPSRKNFGFALRLSLPHSRRSSMPRSRCSFIRSRSTASFSGFLAHPYPQRPSLKSSRGSAHPISRPKASAGAAASRWSGAGSSFSTAVSRLPRCSTETADSG